MSQPPQPDSDATPAPATRWRGGFRILWVLLLVLAALLALDLNRAPQRQLSARVLLAAIDFYQAALSPIIGRSGVQCRFQPTCSHYGEQAIRHHGALEGTRLTAVRLLRCGPWTAAGTEDPPPGPADDEDQR